MSREYFHESISFPFSNERIRRKLLPDSTKEDMSYLTTVGRVVALGDLAYMDKDKLMTIRFVLTDFHYYS